MTDLCLDDGTFESDGICTRLRFHYGSPYENGGHPDVSVQIDTFKRIEGKGFDFEGPKESKYLVLDEVNIGILAGYLTAVNKLMWRQWTQYEADPANKSGDKC